MCAVVLWATVRAERQSELSDSGWGVEKGDGNESKGAIFGSRGKVARQEEAVVVLCMFLRV